LVGFHTLCFLIGCGWQAEGFGTTILDEDGLLKLIRTKPGKKSKYEIAAEAEVSMGLPCPVLLLFITIMIIVSRYYIIQVVLPFEPLFARDGDRDPVL